MDLSQTFAFRLIPLDGLPTLLSRGRLHAPNMVPPDDRPYPAIHDADLQPRRARLELKCGPGGVIGDYVSFYFGRHSPMLLRLATGRVRDFPGNQDSLVYLVTSVQDVIESGREYLFTDGHSFARFTRFFTDPRDLSCLDWRTIQARHWTDTPDDNDRQRRKQAELLIHRQLPWTAIRGIGVRTERAGVEVLAALGKARIETSVKVLPGWYYEGSR